MEPSAKSAVAAIIGCVASAPKAVMGALLPLSHFLCAPQILVWKELNYGHMRDKEKQLVVSEVRGEPAPGEVLWH